MSDKFIDGTDILIDRLNSLIDFNDFRVLEKYRCADVDDSGETKYYGFITKDGEWYILKEYNNTFRYVKGTAGYSTFWANRANLTYDYFSNVF